MKRQLNTLVLLLLIMVYSSAGIAQVLPKRFNRFIEPGSELLDFELGDLNLDGKEDLLLAVKINNEDSISNALDSIPARQLFIFIQQNDGTYKQRGFNDKLILCLDCGGLFGDPFAGLQILDGDKFTVFHYGGSNWRWTHDYHFKFEQQNDDWFLEFETETSFNTLKPDSTFHSDTTKHEIEERYSFSNYVNPLSEDL